MIAKPSAKWYRLVFALFWIVLGLWSFQVCPGYGDPGLEYLAQTMECEWNEEDPDDELVKLARQLDNNPVNIYNWVYANIYHPAKSNYYYYSGSRTGARVTFRNLRGNHWDTSSLLIALLRISGIPARYVKFDNSDYVFVQAWLSQSNYRGAGSGADKGWVPLAPWYKEYHIVEGLDLFPGQEGSCDGNSGIPCDLEFNFEDYLSSVKYKTPLELFEESIQAYLQANYPGKNLKDIPRQEILRHTPLSILPAQLPAKINFIGTRTSYSEVPEQFRSNITLRIKRKSNHANLFSEYKVYLPQIAGKRFCLDWVSAGTGRYKPVLKVNGLVVHGNSAGDPSIGSDEKFYVAYIGGDYPDEVVRPAHGPGTFMQIALDPLSASYMTIEKLKIELQDMDSDVVHDENTREAYLGRMGAILTETYLARLYDAEFKAAELMQGRVKLGISPTFIYTLPEAIPADEESKFFFHPLWNIDAKNVGGFYKYAGSDLLRLAWDDPVSRQQRWIAGYESSYNEARIFEDWMDTPALSTIKGIMVANEELNIEVAELDGDDIPRLESMKYRANFDWNRLDEARWDILFNYFLTDTNQSPPPGQEEDWKNQFKNSCRNGDIPISYLEHLLMPDYIPADSLRDETIDDIIAFILSGEIVTAPLELIRYKDMRGYVMMTNGPTSDGYLFNMDNGGKASATIEPNPSIVDYSSLPVRTDVPEEVANHWENTYSTLVQGQRVTTLIESKKVAAALSAAGDPVNMVNGEFYQQEKPDIFIPSRGFNLAVTRKYKSQLIYNGPFGYGWAWNHAERLILLDGGDVKYYDNNCTPYDIKNNGDGTYTYPPGLMIRLEKTGSEYTITLLKTKITLSFSNTGLLTGKEDGFGNTLTFLYDPDNPNTLTTIRDSLNRDLTLFYNPSNQKIERIKDFTGRSVRYDYDGDDLVAFTDLENNTTRFEYLTNQENELNNHNMSKYVLPNEDYLEIGYYKNDQVALHRNRKGETFNFMYSRLNRYAETWNEEGYYRKVFFNENNDVTRVLNEDGTVERMAYDEYHNMLSKIDANGYTTVFDYYPAGGDPAIAADRNLYKATNALGETTQFRYDDPNNPYAPSEISDPEGNLTQFEYYAHGGLYKKIAAPGFAYDAGGRLVASAGAPGLQTVYSYDAYGNLAGITDPLGNAESKDYDTNGLYLISSTDKNGYTTTYEFYESGANQPVGMLKSLTVASPANPAGIKTTYAYNHYNQKRFVTDALNNETEFQYNANRKITRKIAPNGAVTELVYDTARDIVSGAKVIEIIDPLGNSEYFRHDQLGNVIEKEDKNGNLTEYFYDGMNRVVEQLDPFDNSVTTVYDGNGNVVAKTDKNGNETTFVYDPANRLKTKTDPEGNIFQYEYYRNGRLKNEIYTVNTINPISVTTHFDYNALGHLETKTIGYGTGDSRVFEYRYDALGRIKKTIDPMGSYETIAYDNSGNKRFVRNFDSDGTRLRQTEYIYYPDSRNLLEYEIADNGKDSSGAGFHYEYNDIGQLLAETDPVGNRMHYEYDSVGNPVVVYDGAGNITQHFYDLAGRGVKTIDADTQTTSYRYDGNGNLVSVIDRQGNETVTYYDALNRKIGVQDALGATTTFDYDANGNLAALSDPNNGTTWYEYDKNSRQTRLTRPMGEESTYEYDAVGNRTAVIDAKGQKITYEFDKFGLLELARYYTATNYTSAAKTVQFTYYANGNLASYDDGYTSATYTYDGLNRKTGETVYYGAFAKSFAYTYPNDWQTQFTGPDGTTLTYDYDAAYRLSTVSIPGQDPIRYSDYQWNSPEKITLPGRSTRNLTYDPLMRIKRITAKDPGAATIMSRTLQYSAEGNIEEKATEHGTYTYYYDDVYQLTGAVNPTLADEGYTYDDLGNRLSSDAVAGSWDYNLNNELQSYDATTFDHDANGNLTSKNQSGRNLGYIYDEADRLVEVRENGATIATYYYDPFGRRLWKKVDGVTTYFLYSDEGLIGEYDATGTEIRSYGYTPGSQWTTNPLFVNSAGIYYWYQNDHLGTPQKITRTDSSVAWAAEYDSFGNVLITTEEITNHLRFAGQYYDTESGLHYNWNRYYDPETGRYLRVDPQADGLNLYAYVYNNPLSFVDPEGLMARAAWDATTDFYSQHSNTINSSLQIAGGIAEATAGYTLGAVLSPTVAGGIAGAAIGTHGVDQVLSGIQSLAQEEKVDAYSSQLMQTAGVSRETANMLNNYASDAALLAVGIVNVRSVTRSVVTTSAPESTVLRNANSGRARETYVQGKLEGHFKNASVQREQYLRTADGKIAKDPLTGTGRRVDHVIIENGQGRYLVETTSKTADKTAQLAKEARIRSTGGTFIRDRNTGELIDISNVQTRLSRRK